jgi:hypothetical protein
MKRKDAQQLAGELVAIRGTPSHYLIEQPQMA